MKRQKLFQCSCGKQATLFYLYCFKTVTCRCQEHRVSILPGCKELFTVVHPKIKFKDLFRPISRKEALVYQVMLT
jgi:hypothetical protein